MKSKKFVALLMAASVLATTAVGCSNGSQSSQSSPGGSGATGTQYKEEIIIAMADEFTTIDPMETTAETNQIVQDCTHDLLTDTALDISSEISAMQTMLAQDGLAEYQS